MYVMCALLIFIVSVVYLKFDSYHREQLSRRHKQNAQRLREHEGVSDLYRLVSMLPKKHSSTAPISTCRNTANSSEQSEIDAAISTPYHCPTQNELDLFLISETENFEDDLI